MDSQAPVPITTDPHDVLHALLESALRELAEVEGLPRPLPVINAAGLLTAALTYVDTVKFVEPDDPIADQTADEDGEGGDDGEA